MTRDPEEKLGDESITALRFIHGGDVPHVTELSGRQHQERVAATACLFSSSSFSQLVLEEIKAAFTAETKLTRSKYRS